MKQNEFFNILMDGLKDFPETKLQDIISHYENEINLGLASGKTEEEILNELDDPNLIVKKHRNKDLDYNDSGNLNNPATDEINPMNSLESNKIQTADSDELPGENHSFYDLHNSDVQPVNMEAISQSTSSLEDNLKLNNKSDFSSTGNNNYDFSSSNNNINSDFNDEQNSGHVNNIDFNNKLSHYNVNTFLRFCIVVLTLIIFFPAITGIIGFFFGILGLAMSILFGSIGLLIGGTFTSFAGLPNIPTFISNFPYPVIVLFSLGSICFSILLTLLFFYLCKFCIQILIKVYKSLKSKGGAL